MAVKDNTLYLKASEIIDSMVISPTTPGCVLIAKVDKEDVQNVNDIDWTGF